MINGFVVVDKPAGITSHDVVSRVRRIFGTRKVGHTGTLDPFATGVLPIAVNNGTKAIPFLDEGIKIYDALMQLGVRTDTLDMTGTVLSESNPFNVTAEQLTTCFSAFTGAISQIPPMYSAIKQGGQPLYKLARMGQEVERAARPVHIYSIELLSFAAAFASIRVTCSRGTYIRTLADDIGAAIGCGAALKELRRNASGLFNIEKSYTLDRLEKMASEGIVSCCCTSSFAALGHLTEVELSDSGVTKISFGQSPLWTDTVGQVYSASDGTDLIRLSHKGDLVAVARLVADSSAPPKIALKRVFLVS